MAITETIQEVVKSNNVQIELSDSTASIDKTSKNKLSIVGVRNQENKF